MVQCTRKRDIKTQSGCAPKSWSDRDKVAQREYCLVEKVCQKEDPVLTIQNTGFPYDANISW